MPVECTSKRGTIACGEPNHAHAEHELSRLLPDTSVAPPTGRRRADGDSGSAMLDRSEESSLPSIHVWPSIFLSANGPAFTRGPLVSARAAVGYKARQPVCDSRSNRRRTVASLTRHRRFASMSGNKTICCRFGWSL